jgi:hypothetical protein
MHFLVSARLYVIICTAAKETRGLTSAWALIIVPA